MMKTHSALAILLSATTALTTPAFAQDTAAEAAPAAASQDSTADAAPDQEEQVEVSTTGAQNEAIVVRGRRITDIQRTTPEVVSVLSAADIARTGEGDIAGALQRVTGLSVVGNGYVYVRGLGDRYSLALLNGLPLPSPEPLKRVVPLDIFPSSLIASSLVQKSYSPNYPGEFGGGVINLTTTAIPRESFFKVSIGSSFDTETSGETGFMHYGSPSDWTGFDDGTRDIPKPLKAAMATGRLIGVDSLSPDLAYADRLKQMQAITMSLVNSRTTVAQREDYIPINGSAELSAAKLWDIGSTRVGLIASAGYDNSWNTRDAIQQLSSDPNLGNLGIDSRAVRTENHIVVNGLLGLGLEFGEHKLRWNNIFIRDTQKLTRLARGINDFSSVNVHYMDQDTAWYERQLFNTQLVGEFRFDPVKLDLRAAYANSQREAPYERSFRYVFDTTVNDYINNLSQQGSASIAFSDLNEDLYAAGADLSYKFPSLPLTLTTGYAFSDTKRNSVRRSFIFKSADGALNGTVAQQRPDYLLSDYNVQAFNVLLSEDTGVDGAGAFDAGLRVHAGYIMGNLEIADGLSLNLGTRYESARQFVEPLGLDGEPTTGLSTTLKKNYWLPAATLTWIPMEQTQFRLSASKTIARPQFRELAYQVYQDVDSDRQFIGNPFLVDSELWNAEGRFEWYFGRDQRASVAAFYKKIDRPIEAFTDLSSGLRTSFANAPSAQLYGAEVELQKYFPLGDGAEGTVFGTRRAVIVANYTYTKSKLKVGDNDPIASPLLSGLLARDIFNDGDPLTGQSDHLVNLQLGMEDESRLSQQTFMLTYASKRVTSRGPQSGGAQQPDFYEYPGLRLDFVAREGFRLLGAEGEMKLQVRNITGTGHKEYQKNENRRVDINSYKMGRIFSLSASLKF